MYTHLLERDEQVAILRLLGNLAESDDHVSDAEIVHLRAVAQEMGLEARAVFAEAPALTLVEICVPLQRYQARVVAIMELLQLAFADRLVLDVERFKVRAIGEILKLDPQLVERIERWVVQGRQWRAEGRRLITPPTLHRVQPIDDPDPGHT